MHVLITGGAGFIGSNLAAYHLEKGDKVHVVDNLSTGRLKNISSLMESSRFIFTEANLLEWDELDKAVSWADRIYHMAAVVGVFRVLKEPIATLATNIAGCERLLRALHKSSWDTKLIIASTSEVYGNRPDDKPLHEEMELLISPGHNTRWNYAVSKIADEAFALSYAREYDMDITVVRFFNVIGPNQTGKYGMVVPRFIKQALNDDPITVYGDGTQVRAFMDVRDCVNILQRLADNYSSKGETVNVGAPQEITIGSLARMVKELANSDSEITYTSYDDAYGVDFEEIYHRKPELSKLHRLTGYTPEWSLKETISFLIQNQLQKTKD
ncbi:NAD-dependent epimerase/dehydratase family protein [Sulfurimonas sp. C5]|uniref:NAD-dependent epimerase/dehydratase family protein n=1 Tax=Sulfurimonas sp. C5 TaxID=3036947 RepID=UPI0024573321|nr:NAD-dependent epimerase/dehydratase family protein [Sulfurimonas sp. C5]MDH4944785.1 NAD-dependent epimerase/dehydratase family protein [Sulfurimonas sp. C5]